MAKAPKVERKLVAIMFTDIVGYTEQMSKDQNTAFILLEEKQSKLKPLIKEHNGKLVKEMGDGTLSHYPTAVDASKCSVKLQKLIKDNDQLNIRVGIHLGDTTFKGGDVFGDGVNIASRLESMSPSGGVLVSKNVYDELLSRKGFEGISLGLQSLKGVGRLVEVYALKDKHLTIPNPDDYKENKVEAHSDNEIPSIAIIPFKNKGAEEDAFYAYGISTDLITDCSGSGLIRVESLDRIEKIQNYEKLDIIDLSSKLFVRYVSTGTLWKMGKMFQLSIELYDTKKKKVVWSDRWQEKWENLPNIKNSLSNGLLKALGIKPKVDQKEETTNTKAYAFYLEANYKYAKRENIDDTEIVRGLLNKAIDLDNDLIIAKVLLGTTYTDMGDYNEAMEIFSSNLKQAERLGDKRGIKGNLNSIGVLHSYKGDYDSALDYQERSLAISKELGDKRGIGGSLNNIGIMHVNKGDLDKALDYYNSSSKITEELGNKSDIGEILNNIGLVHVRKGDYEKGLDYQERSLAIRNELGDKAGMGGNLLNIGNVYNNKGDWDKAQDYYERSLAIRNELGNKFGMGLTLNNLGVMYSHKGDYEKAEEYLEKSLVIQKEIGIGSGLLLLTTTYLYVTYKHLGKDYDVNKIHSLIKDDENKNLEFLNLRLYELLEDKLYLKTAYKQVQDKASAMDEKFKEQFLSYPIPKQIIVEHNSMFS
jgi:class 3 adenylate cyclase/tetratricopeptide (TPR) repeat protein